ncbi:TPA: 30S ribosomal protein S3ae, partial [Thermoplasmata archaeon]|nr:30S ribosomal protein S3ae [Thermoplasmata archaeon]
MAQKARATAKKVKDRWRAKEWYKVYAPDMFSRMQLGETPADSPDNVMGRITEATVQDLTGDFSKMHIKLKFKVHDVRGFEAHTMFAGHDLTSDYVRRLTRRKRTKTDTVVKVVTKDGWGVVIKPMAVSEQ